MTKLVQQVGICWDVRLPILEDGWLDPGPHLTPQQVSHPTPLRLSCSDQLFSQLNMMQAMVAAGDGGFVNISTPDGGWLT